MIYSRLGIAVVVVARTMWIAHGERKSDLRDRGIPGRMKEVSFWRLGGRRHFSL